MKANDMILGQAPPIPDGSTPVEKLLYWVLGVAVLVISYFYKSLETKNGKRIEQLELDLAKCQAEHAKTDERFELLKEEIQKIREQRYKTT